MAKKKNTDFFDALRGHGLRKRVARALSDIDSGSKGARGNAEKMARRVITDLRGAADHIEKRLEVGTSAVKKAASPRKRTAAKKRTGTARKTTARKTTARKTTARKTTARKSTARKAAPRKRAAKKSS
jgi:hypothetical protein